MSDRQLDKDLQDDLIGFLDTFFSTGFSWKQQPYRNDFFDIWKRARDRGLAVGNVDFDDVRELWMNERPLLPQPDAYLVFVSMMKAWDEWNFAWSKFAASDNCRPLQASGPDAAASCRIVTKDPE